MSRRIVFRSVARLELEAAVAWYEAQRPGLGQELESEINRVMDQIRAHPEQFRHVRPRVRKAKLRRFPYSIYFA